MIHAPPTQLSRGKGAWQGFSPPPTTAASTGPSLHQGGKCPSLSLQISTFYLHRRHTTCLFGHSFNRSISFRQSRHWRRHRQRWHE